VFLLLVSKREVDGFACPKVGIPSSEIYPRRHAVNRMKLTDAHMHLPEYPVPSEVIEKAKTRGMRLLSCTVAPAQAELNVRLADENHGTVWCFLGVHPSDAPEGVPVSSGDPFWKLLERCDGIGEIGLDPKYSTTDEKSAQMKWFVAQLAAAEKLDKPVQVHSRGSEKECLDILGTFRLPSVMMHWFEGQADEAVHRVVSRGYFVSFGPALLYSKRIRRLAERIPEERLLTESDGPVAFGALGGIGGPDAIPSVLFGLAEVRGRSFDEMGIRVEENSGSFLNPG
jgi:TatD DNase family protein